MAESLISDWLVENSYRAYPLSEQISRSSNLAYTLTDDIVLDAQLIYTEVPATVEILSITVDVTNVTITVTGPKSFVIPKASTFPYYCRIVDGSLLVVGEKCIDIPVGTHNFTNVSFEPSISYEFGGPWLGVESLTFDTDPESDPKTGVLTFIEGYQFNIHVNGQNLNLGAGSRYGVPVSCEVFGSIPNNCDDILSFIHGVAPVSEKIKLIAGSGIVVLDDPENYRIYVGLSFDPKDVCKKIIPNPAQ